MKHDISTLEYVCYNILGNGHIVQERIYPTMLENNYSASYGVSGLNAFLTKVFTKMGLGLFVTAAVAAIGYYTGFYMNFIRATGMFGTLGLVIAQVAIVISLTRRMNSMDSSKTNLLFFAYSALTGFTFSVLLYAYDLGTIFGAFGFTAILFISMAIIGHTTDKDLSKFSTLFMGGLIALVIATLVSSFIPVLRNSLILSYVGILLFLGITAWDMQRIKTIYYQTGGVGALGENLAVFGAMELYLDFINIFLYVLEVLGRRSND